MRSTTKKNPGRKSSALKGAQRTKRIKASGFVRKKAHASSRTKRSQAARDKR